MDYRIKKERNEREYEEGKKRGNKEEVDETDKNKGGGEGGMREKQTNKKM